MGRNVHIVKYKTGVRWVRLTYRLLICDARASVEKPK